MSVSIFQVDAFGKKPFTGNPAAVCLLESETDAVWMQSVANEMNLSETAFIYCEGDKLRLRWFTPELEVDLCGHATIAAAHVLHTLHDEGQLPDSLKPHVQGDTCKFTTRSGVISTTADGTSATIDFPALELAPEEISSELLEGLNCQADDVEFCGRSRFDMLVRLSSAKAVQNLRPSMEVLGKYDARGIIVTALGDHFDHDFVSRFFAPAAGVNEDPVTGSAHCVLGPYWAEEFGRTTLFGYQASSRGGLVKMDVRDDRVLLTGDAVLVLRGSLCC